MINRLILHASVTVRKRRLVSAMPVDQRRVVRINLFYFSFVSHLLFSFTFERTIGGVGRALRTYKGSNLVVVCLSQEEGNGVKHSKTVEGTDRSQ